MESRTTDVNVTYEQTLTRLRNYSFSSYLNLVRESVTAEVGNAGPVRSSLQYTASRRRAYVDGEIDVFGAERYFSGGLDGDREEVVPVEAPRAPAVTKTRSIKTRPSSAVSTCSGASGNSRSRLLREDRRRSGRSQLQDDAKKCLLSVLRCSCSGKRSADVDGRAGHETAGFGEPASKIDWISELRMERLGLGLEEDMLARFPPNLNLGPAKVAVGRESKGEEKGGGMSSSLRTLTLLTPVKGNVPGGGGGSKDDDDTGSESSSDLFEIKSLMIDECPYFGPAGTVEHEPSEASFEWSVVTASAADMPVASERGDHALRSYKGDKTGTRQRRDRSVRMLTGCVSHKAVDVTTAAHKFPERASSEAIAPAMRYHIERFQKTENGRSFRRHDRTVEIPLSGGEINPPDFVQSCSKAS